MEKEEMTRLFQAYADDMLRLAYSYLGSRMDAEDACQTVFLRMAEGRAKPREGKERVFLLTCTANACKDHLRSFRRWNAGALDETIPFSFKRLYQLHKSDLTFSDPHNICLGLVQSENTSNWNHCHKPPSIFSFYRKFSI